VAVVVRFVDRLSAVGLGAQEARSAPVMVWKAPEAGPCVALTANVHGDEITGLAAILELEPWLAANLGKGTVLLYPSVNPEGLAAFSRGVGANGGDLNRGFPGGGRSGAERWARAIWEDLERRRPEVLIDLHADSFDGVPYVILDRPIAVPAELRTSFEEEIAALGRATGLTVLHDYSDEEYRRFNLDRSLTGAAINRWRIPALTIEAGPRRALDGGAVSATVLSVQSVLSFLGLTQNPLVVHPSRAVGGPWERSTAVRTSTEGYFRPLHAAGGVLRAGEPLGEVLTLAGELLERIDSPYDGVVVSWTDRRWLKSGTSVGTFGFVMPD